ncbi:MAG: selenium cofactor biosynthesis protein YqeC [Desulfohalobiaceae bacterium]
MQFPSSFISPDRGGVLCLVGSGGKTSLMFALAAFLAGQGKRVLSTTTTRIRPPGPQQSPLCACAKDPLQWLQSRSQADLPAHVTLAADHEPDRVKLVGYDPETIDRLGRSGLFHWILAEADGAAGRPLKAPGPGEPVISPGSDHVVGVVGLDGVWDQLTEDNVFRCTEYSALSGIPQGDAVTPEGAGRVVTDKLGLFRGTPEGAKRIVLLNKAESADRRSAGHAMAEVVTLVGLKVFLGSLRQGWLEGVQGNIHD